LAHYWRKDGAAGVFIPGQRDLQVGESVALEVSFAEPRMSFHLRGTVRWRRTAGNAALPAGTGVAFRPDEERTHAVLLDFATDRADRSLAHRGRRLPVAIGVRCVADGKLHVTRTQNVSTGGVFIAAQDPPEVGTLVSLSLFSPRDRHPVEVDGTVVWRQTAGDALGFGVRFFLRDANTANHVEELVAELKRLVASRSAA